MHSEVTATAAAVFPVLVVWAGAVDAVSRSIPNAVVATLAACFAVFAVAAGLPARDVSEHLLCAFAVLACGFVLFSISVLGAGDAKLLAGAALWFGFDKILPFIASVAFAGGLLALAYLAANALRVHFGWPSSDVRTVPYGAAIAAGALAVLPDWLAAF
jgi:prepilin peptidase CpaA